MRCPKCLHENRAGVQFCARCHNPLSFVCPACKHQQNHGGKCDQCGVGFTKYAMLMVMQAKRQVETERDRAQSRKSVIRQIVLLPITGGLSLVKSILSRLRGR